MLWARAMQNVSLARRYARALIDVAMETESLDAVNAQLNAIASLFGESAEFVDVMNNPAYSRAQRTAVVDALLRTVGKVEKPLESVLHLLVDRNRLGHLPEIARVFGDLADARAGRVRGSVTSAVKLPPDAIANIQRGLAGLTNRDVILEQKVDPRVIGGVATQVGSVVYDGTLRSQLEDLRRTLKS